MSVHKRDFSAEILDLDGNPVRIGLTLDTALRAMGRFMQDASESDRERFNKLLKEEADAPLTLGRAASGALTAPRQGEDVSDEERVSRLGLALLVHSGGVIGITPAQREMMKKCIGKHFLGALVAPRCWELLEKAPQPEVVANSPERSAQAVEGA